MTQDHFLLKILFVGRSRVTDPYRNQIENLILWIRCFSLKFNLFVGFHILKILAMDKMNSHNFNGFTVLYNGYGKKQFLYLSVLLGSPSMTQDY